MPSNLDRYRKDLEELIKHGALLLASLGAQHSPEAMLDALRKLNPALFEEEAKAKGKAKAKAKAKTKTKDSKVLLDFTSEYQQWYSEAKVLVKQLLPDRLGDFTRYYETPKNRKEVSIENYTIEDALRGLSVSRAGREIVGSSYTIHLFRQQFHVLESVEKRFESSLFEIRQLVQADLFDSELESAHELAKHKFARAAGAVAGVVLEKHFAQVAENHSLKQAKKNPGINDWNQLLRDNDVIDVPSWRFIQHLGDLRNLCDHNKKVDPTVEQAQELVNGVSKIVKTVH